MAVKKKPTQFVVTKKVPGVFDNDGKTVVFSDVGATVEGPAAERAAELYPGHFTAA